MNIKRELFEEIKSHLSKKEISLIIGPRQVGKTTIMEELIEYLKAKGEKTVFFNLDYELDKKLFDSQEELIKKIEYEIGDKGYVFIDEIQRKENAGLFLKGIYDRKLPYKLIVSGSGSLELKEKISESLAGRKRMFLLRPISLKELINFRTEYKYEDRIEKYFDIEPKKAKMFLEEYLNFGGYPKVILGNERSEKNKIMDEIFRSCVEKDLLSLLNIDRPEAFSSMIKILSSQTGQLLNYSKLGKQISLTFEPLKKYLWYGEKTFLIEMSFPYFSNKQKEITKAPLIYFIDLGLRNFSINMMGNIDSSEKFGLIFQNFIFNILKEKIEETAATINFWRTLSGSEVDLIINKGNEIIPIEVKYSDIKTLDIKKPLIKFIEEYNPKEAWVINLSFRGEKKVGETTIKFLPYYDLLREDFKI
ncbi:MAG: ATP-binding protein [Candidatus Paceibacterota bacterium]|jgi:hypothetical protein